MGRKADPFGFDDDEEEEEDEPPKRPAAKGTLHGKAASGGGGRRGQGDAGGASRDAAVSTGRGDGRVGRSEGNAEHGGGAMPMQRVKQKMTVFESSDDEDEYMDGDVLGEEGEACGGNKGGGGGRDVPQGEGGTHVRVGKGAAFRPRDPSSAPRPVVKGLGGSHRQQSSTSAAKAGDGKAGKGSKAPAAKPKTENGDSDVSSDDEFEKRLKKRSARGAKPKLPKKRVRRAASPSQSEDDEEYAPSPPTKGGHAAKRKVAALFSLLLPLHEWHSLFLSPKRLPLGTHFVGIGAASR